MALITEAVPETASPAANTPSRLVAEVNGSSSMSPRSVVSTPKPSGMSGAWPTAKMTVSASTTCSESVDRLDLRDAVLVEAEALHVEELHPGHPARPR